MALTSPPLCSENLPKGFRFAGLSCGIKNSGAPDLALFVSEAGSVAAGVYTQNVVRAASIDWNRSITPSDSVRAVVVNSGNANACTGDRGVADNQQLAALVAEGLNCQADQVLVMSTGIIGEFLPMSKLTAGIQTACSGLSDSADAFARASEGILTTDVGPKVASGQTGDQENPIRLAGVAKGAGMIGPNMATMLSVVLTDAALSTDQAEQALRKAVDLSFNAISVEGHTSTSDAVVLLASGKSGQQFKTEQHLEQFQTQLNEVCVSLAKQIPADGEGASHLIALHLTGLNSESEAKAIAKSIANSALVKTAVTGGDPNWGRIISAAGYAGVDFDPMKLGLKVNGHAIYQAGQPLPFDAVEVSQAIKDCFETTIELDFGAGQSRTTFWTSDLTTDYVSFNSEYHT